MRWLQSEQFGMPTACTAAARELAAALAIREVADHVPEGRVVPHTKVDVRTFEGIDVYECPEASNSSR